MVQESVPPNRLGEDPEVFTDHEEDEDPQVETSTAEDSSLRVKRIRPRETLERGASQAGPSRPTGQPEGATQTAAGSAPVTRDELMRFMPSFKGEIKELITKSRAGPSKGQSVKKTPPEKRKSVRNRQPTPHPKEKAAGTIDW